MRHGMIQIEGYIAQMGDVFFLALYIVTRVTVTEEGVRIVNCSDSLYFTRKLRWGLSRVDQLIYQRMEQGGITMKVVTLFGSPRPNGNTATLANAFNETAEEMGADVKSFMLNKLDFRGCQACDACKTQSDKCVLKDDLAEVLEAVANTDILVLATPIYFAEVTAQLKTFVDRCYSYLEPFEVMPETSRLKPGKKMVLIMAQNRGDELFADVCQKYRMIFEFLGFKETHLIRGCELLAADALKTKNRNDLIEFSRETARKILG